MEQCWWIDTWVGGFSSSSLRRGRDVLFEAVAGEGRVRAWAHCGATLTLVPSRCGSEERDLPCGRRRRRKKEYAQRRAAPEPAASSVQGMKKRAMGLVVNYSSVSRGELLPYCSQSSAITSDTYG